MTSIMSISLGFGTEFETEAEPKQITSETKWQLYQKFARYLSSVGIPARGSNGSKYPPDNNYGLWWITNDASITTHGRSSSSTEPKLV